MNIYIYIIRRGIKVHASEIDTAVIHLYATTLTVKRNEGRLVCGLFPRTKMDDPLNQK